MKKIDLLKKQEEINLANLKKAKEKRRVKSMNFEIEKNGNIKEENDKIPLKKNEFDLRKNINNEISFAKSKRKLEYLDEKNISPNIIRSPGLFKYNKLN